MQTTLHRGFAGLILALALLAATATAALACNKNFVVYNRTDKMMTQFFVSPYQSDNWEDNVLRADIDPDTHTRVDMSDDTREYSLYDVKAVFEDGTKTTGYKINLCRAQAVYIYSDRVTYSDGE